jgi:hypothetical protein
LTRKNRAKIIALLANGSSRRMAARYVGCAPSTITRTAARIRGFAEQMAVAEQNADIDALRSLRVAARKPRYWRAAAWLLERRNPDEFARRTPNTYTTEEFSRCMAMVANALTRDLPEENYERVMKELDRLHEMTKEDVQADRAAPFKMADLEKEWAEADRQRKALEREALERRALEREARERKALEHDPLEEDYLEDENMPIGSDPFSAPRLVQHPSPEASAVAFPALAVTPETPYTSESQP